jgi:hypothetical protein
MNVTRHLQLRGVGSDPHERCITIVKGNQKRVLWRLLVAHGHDRQAAGIGESSQARVVHVEKVKDPATAVEPEQRWGGWGCRRPVNAHWYVCGGGREKRGGHVQNGLGGASQEQAAAGVGA